MFAELPQQPADTLLSLIKLHNADERDAKIDLGVGVYRNENGQTPVFGAVKLAEQRLVDTQSSKSYLGPEGDVQFVASIATLALADAVSHDRLAGLQTPGGTGALRLALELYVKNAPEGTIWVGTPTWPVHMSMLKSLGAKIACFDYYDIASQQRIPDANLQAIAKARPGDLILLQGCCHNPTGCNPDLAEWQALATACEAAGVIPLVDLAYHGLGEGLDDDAAGVRLMAKQLPEMLIAYSCDKNFGLYRDRVGAVFALCQNVADSDLVKSNFAVLARNNWSMPPDHGGAVVSMILRDPELRENWQSELQGMQERLRRLRVQIAAYEKVGSVDLRFLAQQTGMFAMLPLAPDAIVRLREKHAVYMVGNGRINVAGLLEQDVDRFVSALDDVSRP
jgi:aromatic-amino-acid transaminase